MSSDNASRPARPGWAATQGGSSLAVTPAFFEKMISGRLDQTPGEQAALASDMQFVLDHVEVAVDLGTHQW